MKIRLTNRAYKAAASTLVIVLIIGAVLCVGVSYYLSLVQQQSLLSSRSQGWNLAISIAEAGIEEGLQQLNSNADHLAADGWAFDGTYYLRTNNMPNGGFYTIS